VHRPDAHGAETERDARYRPLWFRFAPFLGRPPALTRRQWSVLGLVSLVSMFEQYDVYLFSLNLAHISASSASTRGSSACSAGWCAPARSARC